MSKRFRKLAFHSLVLMVALNGTSVRMWMPAATVSLQNCSSSIFLAEAINPSLVWVRSQFPSTKRSAIFRRSLSHPTRTHESSSPGSLGNIIDDSISDLAELETLTVTHLNDPEILLRLDKIKERQDLNSALLSDLQSGVGISLYTFFEEVENRLLGKPLRGQERAVDMAMITFPLLQAKTLAKITGDEKAPDRLKDRLWTALRQKGLKTAMSGGRILVMDVPSNTFAETIHPLIQKFIDKSAEKAWKEYPGISPEALALYKKGLQNLKFYASHVRLRIDPTSELIRRGRSDLEDDVTPAQYARLNLAERKQYVDEQDTRLRWRRQSLSQLINLSLPNNRKSASHYTEELISDAFLRLNERVEVIEKATDPLRDTLDAAAEDVRKKNGISGTIPVLDDETVSRVKEKLSQKPGDVEDRRSVFYEAIYQGRLKAIPLLNFSTGRLPRISHLMPYDEQAVLQEAMDEIRKNPTGLALDHLKGDALLYYARLWQMLIYESRTPRYAALYRLDRIQDVAQAEVDGSLARLFSQIAELTHHIGPAELPEIEMERLKAMVPLYTPGILVVKRDVGDEIMVALLKDGRFQVAMAELNKFNARQQNFPPDDIDSLQHQLQERLIDILAGRRWSSLAEAMTWWQQEISELAPELFQVTDKVSVSPDRTDRLPLFTLKDRKPWHFWIPSKIARGSDGTFYQYQYGWNSRSRSFGKQWRVFPTREFALDHLQPVESTLSAAVVVSEKLYTPSELEDAFIHLSEDVSGRQKKVPVLLKHVSLYTLKSTLKALPIFTTRPGRAHALAHAA